MSKKRGMFLIFIISIVILLAYTFIISRYETKVFLDIKVTEEGGLEAALLEQQFLIWEKPALKSNEYNVAKVNLQGDYNDAGNYFFLPQYMDLSEVYAVISFEGETKADVYLDDVQLMEDTMTTIDFLKEGEHVFRLGGKEIAFHIMKGSNLPSIWIDTDLPMTYVLETKGNETPGNIQILSGEGKNEYSGKIESFRGRGNSTWYQPKKSFGVTLSQSASLLGMTPGKSWVLLGGAFDDTTIRNKIVLDMAQECGIAYAVDSEPVDMYINGEYKGCYLLTEKITVATGRMEIGDLEEKTELINDLPLVEYPRYVVGENVVRKGYIVPYNPQDISGGYLMEVEIYIYRYGEENSGFITDNGIPVVMVSPDYASAQQVEYIANIVQAFEDAIESPDGYNSSGVHYSEYIDMESFALRYLIDEYSKSLDAGYSSYFFYKPQGDDKMYAGPIWDYDTSLGENGFYGDPEVLRDPEGMYVNRYNWSALLWAQQDFVEMCSSLYEERCLPYLNNLTENGLDQYIEQVYDSAEMNAVYYRIENLDEEFAFLKNFAKERKEYLEEELSSE